MLFRSDGDGYAYIYLNGNPLDSSIIISEGTETKNGFISASKDDIIKLEVRASYEETGTHPNWTSRSMITYDDYVYDPTNPNYTKTISYSHSDSIVNVSFFDGFGRTIQNRSSSISGSDSAIVSGIAEYDVLGNVLKSYKFYSDIYGDTRVDDFNIFDTVLTEISAYYGATGPGLDYDGVPYSANEYSSGIKSKLNRSASASSTWALDSGHESEFISYTVPATEEIVSISYDPDSIQTLSVTDRWGRYTKKYSFVLEDRKSVV